VNIGVLGRLFGVRKPLRAGGEVRRGNNWYHTAESRGLRQIVLVSEPERKTASRFLSGGVSAHPRYRRLLSTSPLATGSFRLNSGAGPYLMVRTDGTFGGRINKELVDLIASSEFRVAFTFAHLPESGLVAVFVSCGLLKSFSTRGFLEQIYGLDDDDTWALLSDAINNDAVRAVLAGDSGWKYDIEIPFDSNCKRALSDEWRAVVAYHRKIRRPDFEAAGRRLYKLIPEGSDPIIGDTPH